MNEVRPRVKQDFGAKRPGWWQHRSLSACCLLPVSLLFWSLVMLRRAVFRHGVCRRERLPVPVIIVGNVAVGGSGKTPVVQTLVGVLRDAGYQPGIISRGYGAAATHVREVTRDDDPAASGDEPLLLARTTGVPVFIGADRPAAGRALLGRHPKCNVLISDDGLQHYRLDRDAEIIVVDEAVLGNRWLLPAGPLREPLSRLEQATLVITHGVLGARLRARVAKRPAAVMRLEGALLRNLVTGQRVEVSAFLGQRVHALAGIGRPERFFAQLRAMGLDVVGHPFGDHHRFSASDLAFAEGEPKILTSKDAVKCAAFASDEVWEFPVTAQIEPASAWRHILERLEHGSTIA